MIKKYTDLLLAALFALATGLLCLSPLPFFGKA